MEIYSELIKSIEQGNSLEEAAKTLKSKLAHFIEITKQEIDLLKQQETLLQRACNHYNNLAQKFPDRNVFLSNISNKDMHEVRSYSRPPMCVSMVAEAISIFLSEKERWNSFYQKLFSFRSTLLDMDYNQISEQALYDLEIIFNANQNNVNTMRSISLAAINLYLWLSTTYNWAITIRDHFQQFTSFKEIERLLNKDFIEYSNLITISTIIQNKEIQLGALERTSAAIIENIL